MDHPVPDNGIELEIERASDLPSLMMLTAGHI
jgi:hypothetical protein